MSKRIDFFENMHLKEISNLREKEQTEEVKREISARQEALDMLKRQREEMEKEMPVTPDELHAWAIDIVGNWERDMHGTYWINESGHLEYSKSADMPLTQLVAEYLSDQMDTDQMDTDQMETLMDHLLTAAENELEKEVRTWN